jgi:hypothetical protein
MEPGTPSFNLTDSVQVGHNTVGPSTGDIVIQSGNNVERCSMCKTPIDASTNPGLYCFKEAPIVNRSFEQIEGPVKNHIVRNTLLSLLVLPFPLLPPGFKQLRLLLFQ